VPLKSIGHRNTGIGLEEVDEEPMAMAKETQREIAAEVELPKFFFSTLLFLGVVI
jgi:hypothetical protein